jgi:predicted ATPase
VLVVDDLHQVDDAGLLVWHGLSKTARQSPLLLVGACRPLPRRTEIDRLRSAVAFGGGEVLRLGGLSSSEAGELAAQLLDARPGPDLLATIACAAGNPQFLRDIVDVLVRDGAVSTADGVAELVAEAEGLRSVITERLDLLTGATRKALHWATTLEPEFDLADLATLMNQPATELIRAVEEAIEAGVLTEAGHLFTFRHPLLRANS